MEKTKLLSNNINFLSDRDDLLWEIAKITRFFPYDTIGLGLMCDKAVIIEDFEVGVKTKYGDRILLIISEVDTSLIDAWKNDPEHVNIRTNTYKVYTSSKRLKKILEGIVKKNSANFPLLSKITKTMIKIKSGKEIPYYNIESA